MSAMYLNVTIGSLLALYMIYFRGQERRSSGYLHAYDSGAGGGYVSLCKDWSNAFYCGKTCANLILIYIRVCNVH